MTTITPEGEKALNELKKKHEEELKKQKDEFDVKKKKIAGDWADEPSRLKKLRFWGRTMPGDTKDPRYWALVNIKALQEFVKYGANKVLDQIRVRTHANIMAREEIERVKQESKKGFDAKSFAFSAILVVMAAAIAFILVSNFFNYKTMADDNVILSKQVGTVSGQLAACQSELSAYKPNQPTPPGPGGSGPDNVLEG